VGKATQLTVNLLPPKIVTGRVVAGTPPKPVAGAMVGYPLRRSRGAGTDNPIAIHPVGADGTFKIPVPFGDSALIWAGGPVGSPFQQVIERVEFDGDEQANVELALPAAKR
jgi:hypothetical protein